MFRPKVVSVAALLALCLPSVGLTATIHVPADQPTIQAGIDAALAGDTVLVADGIYTGEGNRDIDFGGKGIVLKSENGPEVTIIDCEGRIYYNPHRGFSFHNGEDSTAVVSGFTIQGGRHSVGGAVYCYRSNPTIINNVISGNETSTRGGGIYCYYSNPSIMNNSISGNSADHGGGIYCSYSNPTISSNFIIRNSATGFEMGAGSGGGIGCDNSNPTIINNTIYRNSSGSGGGIRCYRSNPTIISNSISGNSGSGIHCSWSSSPVIKNTILWANSYSQVVGGSPVITYCDIQGGREGEGNIDADPLFVAPYDGNICSQSPCIDAGDPSMLDPDGSPSDIGRFFPEHPECSLGNIWYVSTAGSDTAGDGFPGNPFRTIQYGVDVSLSSDTVIVASGTYEESVTIWGKSILLTSEYLFSGDTLDIHNTIIDGAGSVVTFVGCDSLSGLTGFTIQGGYGFYGGGIACYNSNPTISNNGISGNSVWSTPGYGGDGGGIFCYGSNPTIINNSISGNSAVYGSGGGIYCVSSDPTISNNSISGNSANSGGGIYCQCSNPTINNNIISGNSATGYPGYSGYGGGIYCYRSDLAIINNSIIDNSASSEGGAIICWTSNSVITNTIVAFNRSSSGAIWCTESSFTLTCCDVYGNEGGDWVGCIADQAGINGNFSTDPLFCYRAAGDFHLSSISPCAAGNNSCGELIGALGVACDPYVCGDADGDGQLTLGDLELIRAFYFDSSDWPTPLAAGDANCSGVVNIGDIIYLADYLFRNGADPCCP